jgi:hypothetical protein
MSAGKGLHLFVLRFGSGMAGFGRNRLRPCRISGLLFALLACGCSTDAARRTAYETLRNMDRQQCEKAMSSDCASKSPSYDDYRRERKDGD